MVNDDNDYKLDVYKIDTRTKLDKKRIFIMVILILLLFCILLTINHIKNLMEEYKVYKQYEAQLNSIKHQEEEKQAKIKEETEKKKKEEAKRLIDECPEPLKSVVKFALATGLRKSNIINLEWQQIDMQRRVAWVNPEESKSNRAIVSTTDEK